MAAAAKVFVGNLEERVSEKDLEAEFAAFGPIRSVWVARRPPGYGFIEFQDRRDALDSIRELDGRNGWRVELSHSSKGSGDGGDRRRDRDYARGGGSGADKKCFECGEPGHFARECKQRLGAHGHGRRRRSPSPRYRSSPSYGRTSARSRSRSRRSPSPRARRSRSRSHSPRLAPSPSPSPPPYCRSSPLYTSNANSHRARRSRS